MQQSQHYSFGWQISIHQHSVLPLKGSTQPSSTQCLRYISEEILFGHFVTTLNDAFEWELTLEDAGYESGSESSSIPTCLHQAP